MNIKKLLLLVKICELCYGKYLNFNIYLMFVQYILVVRDDFLFVGIDRLIVRGIFFKQFKEKME